MKLKSYDKWMIWAYFCKNVLDLHEIFEDREKDVLKIPVGKVLNLFCVLNDF